MPRRSDYAHHWLLDPAITFLNHGSFGATPARVLDAQTELRRRLEAEPVRFMVRELEGLLDEARRELAAFVGARPENLAFVPNATAGVNAVLRSLPLRAGDEILTTTQEYNACRNVVDFVCASTGAKAVVAELPFPVESGASIIEALLARLTSRTRVVLLDHVTSQTALVFPVAEIAPALAGRGIDLLVDGAHAPGMIPLDLERLGASWYTANCHKWICAPKGAAFLWARSDRRDGIRPVAISHGANSPRTDRSRFLIEFDWTGTFDPTAWLSVPVAIRFVGSILDGGWPELMRRNHELALAGRDLLCRALGIAPPAPDDLLGSMASVPLPDGRSASAPSLYGDPLQDALLETFEIEVPIVPWPAPPKRVLRISAQIYNTAAEYGYLCEALTKLLAEERGR
ncbi:MAG TPA: aminotransferase class V-fold PLP-dependent enzyme [Thermoanaerobaculia bacterium]|nr:aminotransferase class V-fold PLP-dependent enzyme [Thermoanaerobaculia bacterium]